MSTERLLAPAEVADFCRRMPKAELHAHASGSPSVATVRSLLERRRLAGAGLDADATARLLDPGSCNDVASVFALFPQLHELIDSPSAAAEVAASALADFADDGVRYVELRTTPRDFPSLPASAEDQVTAVLRELENSPVEAGLLVSVDRQRDLPAAWRALELATAKRNAGRPVVGIDLCGDPRKNDASSFVPIFEEARRRGLRTTMHLAEIDGSETETLDVLSRFVPDRIGHGTFLMRPEAPSEQQRQLERIVADSRCCLELCLTSNVRCGTVASCGQHHFRHWRRAGQPLAICTDDKFVFNTSLSAEFTLAAAEFDIRDRRELFSLSEQSLDSAFAPEAVRRRLKSEFADWLRRECDADE